GGESSSANGVATSYNQARIHTETAGDIFDFNAGYDVGLGEGATATISAGVRYAEFHQSSTVNLFYNDSEQETTAHRRSQFTGVGPELGAKAEYAFGHQGFSVEGSVLGSILFGRQKSLTSGTWTNYDGSSENDPLGSRQLNKASTAKTVNAEVGLTYNAQSGLTRGAALTFGYKVSYYAGVVDTGNGSSGDGLGRYGKVSDDILSHGPFIRLSYKR
ncbi:MAG TPA: Lpg1974 family pore-forming outer membrane protein, partial [Novosphingobium sp.]|nr:Lpg1974 family pore-forming outer membrane protein [Novosphingobium sp.]